VPASHTAHEVVPLTTARLWFAAAAVAVAAAAN
jgi:hypothetical protein